MVTSDKSYENMEWIWGYKETDKLEALIHIVRLRVLQNLQ